MAGLLIVKNNEQLNREERERLESIDVVRTRLESNLSSHIRKVWERNQRAKVEQEQKMLKNLKQRKGVYDAQKLALIRATKGSEIFIGLTSVKCGAAEAWLSDVYSPVREKSWSLKPTPEPELPDYITEDINARVMNGIYQAALHYQQETGQPITAMDFNSVAENYYRQLRDYHADLLFKEADLAAQRMSRRIQDQLHHGSFVDTFEEVRRDMVTFGDGILKGPVIRRRGTLKWNRGPGGRWIPDMLPTLVYEYKRVSPFDIYPSPNALSIADGDLIERTHVSRHELNALIGVSGYNETNLRMALSDYSGGNTNRLAIDSERFVAEGRGTNFLYDNEDIEVLYYWGYVQGKKLFEYGMNKAQIPDPDMDYYIHAMLVGDYVVKVVKNHLGFNPYSKCEYTKIPGAFWGEGVPDELEDLQEMVNQAGRAIANNAAMACLTGDTMVYKNQHRDLSPISLNELWDIKHKHNSGLRRIKIRSVDEETGEIFFNRIVDIFDNGMASVYEVKTERGYTIKATDNHRFMSDDGEWLYLRDFAIGDNIAVNGHRFIDYDKIVSIEYVGDERVFDLQMEAPNHNFIANGFVSHNSGPQVEVNIEKLRAGMDSNTLVPWKIWQTDGEGMNAAPAVRFYQPKAIIQELVLIYDKFNKEADAKTGIPAYAHGDPKTGGASNTASGMSMFLEMSGKVIRELVGRTDVKIVYTAINRTYNMNMLFDPDESIKGDAKVVVTGVNALSMQEQKQIRRQEFLRDTNNPVDVQIMGVDGRRTVLRENAKSLDMDVDKVVPMNRVITDIKNLVDSAPPADTNTNKPKTLDVAGNPSGGVDVNQFNSVSQRGGQ